MQLIAPQKAAYLGGLLVTLAFYFLIISPPLPDAGIYDSQRVIELASLASLCILFPTRFWPSKTKGLAIALFFAAGAISAFMAKALLWALIEHLRFLLLFLLAFSIATMQPTARTSVIHATIFITAIATIKVIIGIYVTSQLGGGIAAIAASFSNHRHFAEFFIAAEGFLAFFLLSNEKKSTSFLAAIPLTSASIIVHMGAGRASGLALLASSAAFIYLHRRHRSRSAVIMALSSLTGWLITSQLFPMNSLESSILRQGDSGRLQLWSAAIDGWLESPFFGVGPMHFASIPNDIAAHPHNAALQILCEWGLISLCFIAIFFIAWWRRVFITRPSKGALSSPAAAAAAAALVGLLLSSMFGGVFVVPAVEFLFFILLGLTIEPETSEWRTATNMPTITRTISLGLCVLCFVTWPSRNADLPRAVPIDAPRFWQNGGLPTP